MLILKVKRSYLGILVAALCLTSPIVMTSDTHMLTGIWKHSGKDVWMEIKFDQAVGTGRVFKNDKKPDSIGKPLLTELIFDTALAKGQALMYVSQMQSRHEAKVKFAEPNLMTMKVKVGFISKTVKWLRVDVNTITET
jgi:hypothetical protein